MEKENKTTPSLTRKRTERLTRRTKAYVRKNRAPVYGRGRSERRWPAEEDYRTTVVFNREQYLELAEVAYTKRVPLKDLMYDFIESGLVKARRKAAKQ